MKIKKPLSLSQPHLVKAIVQEICLQNPHLHCSGDFTLFNPVIEAVNQIIPQLKHHNGGEQLFICGCEKEHKSDCLLGVINADR